MGEHVIKVAIGNNSPVKLSFKDAFAELGLDKHASAKDIYKKALEFIKTKEFDAAVVALKGLNKNSPQSDLVPNAWYWQGEVFLSSEKFDKAKQAFEIIVMDFSGSRKAADASYKFGVTLERMGKENEAKEILTKTIEIYGAENPSLARLAERYLERLSRL